VIIGKGSFAAWCEHLSLAATGGAQQQNATVCSATLGHVFCLTSASTVVLLLRWSWFRAVKLAARQILCSGRVNNDPPVSRLQEIVSVQMASN